MWNRLLDLLQESTIISGLLALIVVGACVYLAVSGQEIPETLAGMALSVIAFFFGSRAGQQAERLRSVVRSQELKEKDYDAWLQSH